MACLFIEPTNNKLQYQLDRDARRALGWTLTRRKTYSLGMWGRGPTFPFLNRYSSTFRIFLDLRNITSIAKLAVHGTYV
jgi:hypothetical protein